MFTPLLCPGAGAGSSVTLRLDKETAVVFLSEIKIFSFTMNSLFILILVGIHGATAVMHSWKAFYTGSTGLTEFPEFVAVNVLDDELMGYFDSRTDRFEGKQSWVMENLGQQYVDQETDILRGISPTFKSSIAIAMQRFNQSKGVHVYQQMYGCEWDDETGVVDVKYQFGYDGEDFVAFDLKTQTWIAPTPQAVITKHKWDNNKAFCAQKKQYLTEICPEWLKKYVNYGSSSLLRTEPPSVSLLQKTPSSPVSCHATGFYPHRAVMFWRKDGEELHEDVDQGEILLNHDGTFQMSVDLSSVKPEDRGRYECVFQLSGVKEDVVTKLDKSVIKTNEEKSPPLIAIIIAAVAVLALVIGAVGFFIYRKKSAQCPPSLKFLPQKPDTLSHSSSGSSTESGDSNTPLMKDKSDA